MFYFSFFLQVKILLAQMNARGGPRFVTLLQKQADQLSGRQLIDYVHSLTSFCRMGEGAAKRAGGGGGGRADRHAPPPLPAGLADGQPSASASSTYENRFNERRSGLEGVLIGAIFSRVVSKLAKDQPDFGLPENMVLILFPRFPQKMP